MWRGVRLAFALVSRAMLNCHFFLYRTATKQLLLTKGDNNQVDDVALYQRLEWLEQQHIIGKMRG